MTLGGPRVDAAVGQELLRAVEPLAIEAVFEAKRMHENDGKTSNAFWSWKSSRLVTKQATPPAILTVVSLPLNWKRTGKQRSGVFATWRCANQLSHRQISTSNRVPSAHWQTIYRRPGMRQMLRCAPASNCCGHLIADIFADVDEDARCHAHDSLARRPTFRLAGPQATDRRTWLRHD